MRDGDRQKLGCGGEFVEPNTYTLPKVPIDPEHMIRIYNRGEDVLTVDMGSGNIEEIPTEEEATFVPADEPAWLRWLFHLPRWRRKEVRE